MIETFPAAQQVIELQKKEDIRNNKKNKAFFAS
jgi:hypothetical protein